jgi:TPP-dependent trihydroxycyclohexane-1,2-dione (THcHDO) dehydratase
MLTPRREAVVAGSSGPGATRVSTVKAAIVVAVNRLPRPPRFMARKTPRK